jgi:salicylate hydroxylase
MALEGAAAVEVLFRSSTLPTNEDLMASRLALFQMVRHPRNTVIKLLSALASDLRPPPMQLICRFYEGPLPPSDARIYSEMYRDFYVEYDVVAQTENAMRGKMFRWFGETK